MLPYYEVCKTIWIQIAVKMSYQFWHKEIFFAKKVLWHILPAKCQFLPTQQNMCPTFFTILSRTSSIPIPWFNCVGLWLEFDSKLEMGGFPNAFCFLFRPPLHIDLNGAFVSKVGMPITVSLFESLSFCRQNIGFSICHIYLSLSCMNSFIHSKLIHSNSQAKSREESFCKIDK